MSDQETCPNCGALRSRHGPDGFCPAHLLALARLETPPSTFPGSTNDSAATRCFGDYELLAVIAKGGIGVVWRARQMSLNRLVALKMIRAGEFATAEEVRRFRTEAEAVANLDHPNIVSIHEIGEHNDFHYFSMKLIEGRDLAGEAGSKPMPDQRRVAKLMKAIAGAVHHAHQRGIIHHDLKPANILLDATCQPHVTDFGIARALGTGTGVAFAGHAVGTPEFRDCHLFRRQNRASLGYEAWLWETRSGGLVSDAFRHESKVATAQFSSNGRWVLTASIDKTARIWDVGSQVAPRAAVLQHNVGVRFAQFSPDDRMILTRCYDNIAYVWQLTPGGWVAKPIYHDGELLSCGFSRDGSNVVTICSDKFCRIFDAQSGLLKFEPFQPEKAVECAEISPDGRQLVTASENTAFLWKLPETAVPLPNSFLELAEALAGSRLDNRNGIEKVPCDNYFKAKAIVTASQSEDELTDMCRSFFGLPTRR